MSKTDYPHDIIVTNVIVSIAPIAKVIYHRDHVHTIIPFSEKVNDMIYEYLYSKVNFEKNVNKSVKRQ